MADYDPKSIPILDDIIDEEIKDETGAGDEQAELAADDNLDLFHDEHDETSPVSFEDETDAPDEPVFNEAVFNETVNEAVLDEQPSNQSISPPSEIIESALIDYRTEEETAPIVADTEDELPKKLPKELIVSQKTNSEPEAKISLQHQVLLEPVVNEIVKQLIPDLEQQLRYLVKQALADRLPEELIKQLNTNDGTEKNTET